MSMTQASEEQEMEAEALTAIFDSLFQPLTPTEWQIDLYPVLGANDEEREQLNHVAIQLHVTLPPDYPEQSIPQLNIQLVKGLAVDEHLAILQQLAVEEAQANLGGPSIFAVCECLKDWLLEHNVKGLDDVSMHAQMMKRHKLLQEQQNQKSLAAVFESQMTHEEMTEAEREELAVRKRREEGTPCTEANFLAWKETFEAEQLAEKENAARNTNTTTTATAAAAAAEKSKSKDAERAQRMTGFEFFSSKAGNADALEKLEAAAEEAERETTPIDEEGDGYDEELFEEDVDLDDLDFDDEDEEDDDGEEEVDI